MARPKKINEEKRLFRINIRFTKDEKQRLSEGAKVCGLPVYMLIRQKLLNGRFPTPKIARADLLVYRELKKIGVNLNQITKLAHSGKVHKGLITVIVKLLEQEKVIIELLLHDSDSENR